MLPALFTSLRTFIKNLILGGAIGLCTIPVLFVAVLVLTFYFFYATFVVVIIGLILSYFFYWIGLSDPIGHTIVVALYLTNALLCLIFSGTFTSPLTIEPLQNLQKIPFFASTTENIYIKIAVLFTASSAVSHGLLIWASAL